ncbi:SpoIIE family protein phosphatase [Candidatus Gottesmanbacteria bacterium]|nr:SpoIIE family protein phosphatase [Candidatus Gottesmanbacteria bacterium]
MKYTVRVVQKYHIAYGLLPFKRNQDVIRIHELDRDKYILCVVDGWNHPKEILSDGSGRQMASIVAQEFPDTYLVAVGRDEKERADNAVFTLNTSLEKRFPRYTSCVASFLIHGGKKDDVVVSVGDVETYIWDGSRWYKPKEISDHWIDPTKYPTDVSKTDVSRFFGCFERYIHPEFSCDPDVMTIPSGKPILIATDGIKDVLTIGDINTLGVNPTNASAREIVETILHEVSRRGTQRDDISLLVRGLDKP